MKVADVLNGVAVGLDAMATAAQSPTERGMAAGAAIVVRTVAEMLTDRTPDECIAILETIRDKGAAGIVRAELDAQTQAVIDAAEKR